MKEQEDILKTIFLKPREYSEWNNWNTHNTRELTPILDSLFTLYKKERRKTHPTKGNSKYHR